MQPLVCAVWGASPAAHRRALRGGIPSARRRFTPSNGSLCARGTDRPVHRVLGYYSSKKKKMQHEPLFSLQNNAKPAKTGTNKHEKHTAGAGSPAALPENDVLLDKYRNLINNLLGQRKGFVQIADRQESLSSRSSGLHDPPPTAISQFPSNGDTDETSQGHKI